MDRIACAFLPRFEPSRTQEVLLLLATLSPLLAHLDADGGGSFFLGLRGMAHVVSSEKSFLEQIHARLRERGFETRVAIADTAFVAWVVAQRAQGIVPPGTAAAKLLDAVTLDELQLSSPARSLLTKLGVKTAGAIARLPAGSLARRLGPEGVRLEKLCRGEALVAHPSTENLPPSIERVALDLDEPLSDLEPLLFLAKSLLDRLLPALARTRRALTELTIIARLDDHSLVDHMLTPESPTLEAAALMTLIRLWFERKPFGAAVASLELCASRTGVASARQLGLFLQREEKETAALEKVVARLGAAFGRERVVRAELGDTFLPEARLRWVPIQLANQSQRTHAAEALPILRKLPQPEQIRWRDGRLFRANAPGVQIIHVDGPLRFSGGWWSTPFNRSYFWLSLGDGALAWIFREEPSGPFFLEALAD